MEKIVVCIKGVPRPGTVKVDPVTHTLRREGAELLLNPHDRPALEMAMRLKNKYGVPVVVLSMGPPNVVPLLKEAYALGADEMILLSDRAFAGADTLATSRVLAKALERLSPFSLVLMGLKSIDGETAQVPPETAALLGIPSVINVRGIAFEEDKVLLIRGTDYGEEELEVSPPLIASVTTKMDYLRPPSFKRILESRELSPKVFTASDLGLSEEHLGLKGSPTQVAGVFERVREAKGEIWEGDPEELAGRLIELLKKRGFIKS